MDGTQLPLLSPYCHAVVLCADRGRKKAALTYVASYVIGCFTKHFNSFGVLFVGRIFCGVATSLLFSAFESWLVAEHFKVEPLPFLSPTLLSSSRLPGSLIAAPQVLVPPGEPGEKA